MADFRCSIVTPTTCLFDESVRYASIPAWDGQLGVMAGASPLLTRLGIGSLRLELAGGGERWFLIEGGFAQVQGDVLTLLADAAAAAESISLEEARAELAEANARVPGAGGEYERVCVDQQRALAKVALASR